MNSGRVLPYLMLILILLGGLPTLIPTVSAVSVSPGTYFTAAAGQRNYTVHHNMNFSTINIYSTYVQFNTTSIVPYGLPTWITLRRINANPLATVLGDKVLEFDYTSSDPSNYFWINGFKNSYNYRVQRNNVNWTYPTSDGSGVVEFTTTLIGTVNIKIYDFGAGPADTTPPTITLNFAGNHSDKGGPYWLPPGETTALSGTNLNGYYTNSSYQNESWIYINASITDDIGVTSTKLHWHNETTNKWYNTTGLVKRNSNYYDYNTSVNITNISIGHKYSFDIYAYDAAGNIRSIFWNKTDLGSDITRRYVYLKNPHSSMEYKILYLNDQKNYSIITDANKKDRFFYDQGTNNFGRDVGFLSTTVPTSAVKVLVNRDNVGGWYNNSSSLTPFTLTNIYYHLWYSFENTQTSVDKIGWIKTRQGLSSAFTNYYTEQRSDNKSSISYNNGMGGLYSTDYLLSIHKLSTTSTSFTDNDIYEGELLGLSTSSHYISVASNRSFTTFLLLNVPSNATLNASYPDSDHDLLSDWMELYRSYTNPFLQDTDNDGFNDTVEYYGGSDPNNYTSTTPPAATAPSVLTNESTNVEETSATLNGWIASDGGADVTSAGFQYGTTTGYGTNLIIEQTADSFTTSGGAYSDFSIYGIYRVAEKYTGFKGTPTISKFNLIQYGSPTGLCYSRIRYVSNDTIIMSVSTDASLVSGWTTFSFPGGTYINSDIYVTFEYPGGSSSNFIRVDTGSPSGRNSYYYNGGWVLNIVAAQYIVFFSNLSFNHGGVFSLPIYGLTHGQLYHFRAFATNSMGTSYGIDRSFVTKPTEPTALSIVNTGSNNVQQLSWTHGVGYNATVMRAKVDGPSYPADPQSDTSIYNGSGTSATVNNTMLLPGRLYYYRAWEYASWGTLNQFSDAYTQIIGLTKPYAPRFTNISITFPTANLSWVKGDGANKTRIVWKSSGFPSSPTDGTLIYNGTASYYLYTITNGTVYYFTAFSYTSYGTRSTYADNHTDFEAANITGGGFIINCYDESTHENLTFNILITTADGTDTYSNISCVNPLLINSSLTPHGPQISIFVSAANHRTRVYTMALFDGVIYTLNAYLPANTTNGTGGCSPEAYMDSRTISSTVREYTINLTHRLHTMIQVEVYNTTLGYWVVVPTDKWINNSNQTVTINETIVNTHAWTITMGRVSYYYLICAGEQLSYLYYFQVVTDPQGLTIQNASIQIKKYINSTGMFDIVSNLYTDSNGNFNIYLIPNVLYKIICDKDGYRQEIVDYIPSTAFFGPIIIKMTLSETIPQPPIIEPESIHFTGELGYFIGNDTYVINLTYFDESGFTNYTFLVITAYNFSTNTSTIIAYYNTTSDQDWTLQVSNIDRNMTYICNLTYVHFYLGVQHRSYILEHQIWIPITPEEVNNLFSWLGVIPFGALNLIMWFLFVAICYYADSRDAGKIIIILGVIYLFLGVYIGFRTPFFGSATAIAGGVLPAIFIAMGILVEWGNSKRRI